MNLYVHAVLDVLNFPDDFDDLDGHVNIDCSILPRFLSSINVLSLFLGLNFNSH